MTYPKGKSYLLLTALIVGATISGCFNKPEQLKVGAGCVNISPEAPAGYALEGYAARTSTSKGLHDSLSARCIVIDDGETEVALIALDVLGLFLNDMNKIARRIERATGISADNIIISTTHTHSAPALMGYSGCEVNVKYKEYVFERTLSCVLMAQGSVKTAVAKFGKGISDGSTGNRRNPDHKLDNELAVMDFQDLDGKVIATLVNFACHPVTLGPDNLLITADYVHYLRENIEKEHGGITVFFNGAIGDVNPYGLHDKNHKHENAAYEMAEKYGDTIGNDALDILLKTEALPINIRVAAQRVMLPVDNPVYYQIAEIPTIKSPIVDGRWQSVISIIDFGPAQILTIPGEAVSAFRYSLEPLLPGDYQFFFGLTNDCVGYIIPESEWGNAANGPYEETVSLSSQLASVLENEYKVIAHELFSEK